MTIDGKIAGTDEISAFNAFLQLTSMVVDRKTWPSTFMTELREVGQSLTKPQRGAVLSQESTRFVYEQMKTAYDRLNTLSPQATHYRQSGVINEARLQIWKSTLADIQVAVAGNTKLIFSSLIPLPTADHIHTEGLRALVKRFKSLKQQDPSLLIDAKVPVYRAYPDSNQLVFVFPDPGHNNKHAQEKLRGKLIKMQEYGINLIGLEGTSRELNYRRDFESNPQMKTSVLYLNDQNRMQTSIIRAQDCVKDAKTYLTQLDQTSQVVHAGYAIECLLGDRVFSMGLDSADLLTEGSQLMVFQPKTGKENFIYQLSLIENGAKRVAYAVSKISIEMVARKTAVSALIYGINHLDDLLQNLEKRHINYIVVLTE